MDKIGNLIGLRDLGWYFYEYHRLEIINHIIYERVKILDGFINKTVCLKYRLDPKIQGRYIYCLGPPKAVQITDKSKSYWQTTIYGEIFADSDKNLNSENIDNLMIKAIGIEGFWEDFVIQSAEQGGDQWREIIGIVKVKEPFEVNPKIYTKVINNIFKKDTQKDVSAAKNNTLNNTSLDQ